MMDIKERYPNLFEFLGMPLILLLRKNILLVEDVVTTLQVISVSHDYFVRVSICIMTLGHFLLVGIVRGFLA